MYSVWLICHECAEGGLTGWYAYSSSEFTDLAADGLELIGAAECAAAVRASRQEDADIGALSAVLDEAMKRELPLEKCVAYIRDNPGEFVDVEADLPTIEE